MSAFCWSITLTYIRYLAAIPGTDDETGLQLCILQGLQNATECDQLLSKVGKACLAALQGTEECRSQAPANSGVMSDEPEDSKGDW